MCCLCIYIQGFPGGAVVKNQPASAGNTKSCGFNPGSGIFPGVGNGNPFQYSCLENSMDRAACWTTVLGSKESDMSEWLITHAYTCIYIHTHILYIYVHMSTYKNIANLYPFICGWLFRLFPTLAVVNNAAMNIGMCVTFWIFVSTFFGYVPRSGITGSYGNSLLIIWEVSIVATPIYVPTSSVLRLHFLHILANICYLLSFWW